MTIYGGASPLSLAPLPALPRLALTARDVSDIRCRSVADPFLFRRDGLWYLFVEAVNADSGRGEIAYATSSDALEWTYHGVVLREPFHLSYPLIVASGPDIFLVPETRQAGAVRLYRAASFPDRWEFAGTLLSGAYADATIAHVDGRWWLFAQRGLDELRLFSAEALAGPWTEHPRSPIRAGNRRVTRPAGRLVSAGGRLIRFAQDSWPNYGSRVRALQIDTLTPSDYAEHEVPESPILEATHTGWNALGMHHVDPHEMGPGSWIAAVDGATIAL